MQGLSLHHMRLLPFLPLSSPLSPPQIQTFRLVLHFNGIHVYLFSISVVRLGILRPIFLWLFIDPICSPNF